MAATALAAGSRSASHGLADRGTRSAPRGTAGYATTLTEEGQAARRPNIVFVLTDDLSRNLVKYMPNVRALAWRGMKFSNYTVSDSLCCPSRSSIFTGMFPHDTKVVSNTSDDNGGYYKFVSAGDQSKVFAIGLSRHGVRTGLMGKYLNQYPVYAASQPGWTEWDASDSGYPEFNYVLNQNGSVVYYGSAPRDYLTTVLQHRDQWFINSSARTGKPFMLEVATFAPHAPYVPAPPDAARFPHLSVPRTPAFMRTPKNAPRWLAHHRVMGPAARARLTYVFRHRVRSVLAVDRMVGALENTLRANGQLHNTVFVFSSDNGFHLGEYRLHEGKQTAFDTDVRVPLIVAGPGVPHGVVNPAVVENVDLSNTFDRLEGLTPPAYSDGRSIAALLHGKHITWRTLALVEHTRPHSLAGDPDAQRSINGSPPSYNAIRSRTFTYVRYADGEHEYYNLTKDPYEINNIYRTLTRTRKAQLTRMLQALHNCHRSTSCWAAGRPAPSA